MASFNRLSGIDNYVEGIIPGKKPFRLWKGYGPMKSRFPASRLTDPASSHEAEKEINQSGIRGIQQEIILTAVRRHPGCTSRELTMFCDLDRYQIARRLSDLENSGHVKKGEIRQCGLGKRDAVTWFLKIPEYSKAKQIGLF